MTKLADASSGATSDVNWHIPAGYVGLTFKTQAGKLVVAALTAGGPAEETNQIHVGDELVGFISNGKQQSLLGRSLEDANRELGGPAGTMITVRTVPKGTSKTLETPMRRKFGKMEGERFRFSDVSASTSPQACLALAQESVIMLDANTGNVLSMIKPVDVRLGGIYGLSQDGKRLACIANRAEQKNDGQPIGLEVFDVERQERTHFATLELGSSSDLRFSPDGQKVLIGDSDRIVVYDLQAKEFDEPILVGFDPANAPKKKKERSPISVAPDLGFPESSIVRSSKRLLGSFDVSPDGKLVAVGSCDGQCTLWSTERHEQLATFGEKQENFQMVDHTAYSPNGQWIAFFSKGTLTIDAVKDELEKSKPIVSEK